MIINLLCTNKYFANVFLIKYHQIYNILYGVTNVKDCQALQGLNLKFYVYLKDI